MFLFCGPVSKNHMLLNLPGILIPQNANHLFPGRLCQLESLSQTQSWEACREGSLVWGPLLTLPASDPSLPIPPPPLPNEKLILDQQIASLYQRERPCRKSWRNRPLFPTHSAPVLHNTSCLFGPFIQMDLFWENLLYSKFLALRLLR